MKIVELLKDLIGLFKSTKKEVEKIKEHKVTIPTKSSKALSAMDPKLRQAYDALCLAYRAEYPGFTFKLTEVYRSVQKQQELYAKGRTAPGKIVTYVDGVKKKGKHNHYPSKAFDIMAYNELTKKGTWDMKYYKKLPKLAAMVSMELGFKVTNGGDWIKLKDYPHFEVK